MAGKGFLASLGVVITNDKKPVRRPVPIQPQTPLPPTQMSFPQPVTSTGSMSQDDIEKFEKHFDDLLKSANQPSPNYYQFAKVDESLEAHLHNDKDRMLAAFTSLNVQAPSMTKQVLISSAQQYIELVKQDKATFEAKLQQKQQQEVSTRQDKIAAYQKKIQANQAQIQALTKDIDNCTEAIQKLNAEVNDVAAALAKGEGSFVTACDAMLNKISSDIDKIQINL
jgi:chromosome segregation ATPase